MSNSEIGLATDRLTPSRVVGTSQFVPRKDEKRNHKVLLHPDGQLGRRPIDLQRSSEEERSQIAREIHDELGSCLMVIKLYLNSLKSKVRKPHLDLGASLEELTELVGSALATVRRITTTLRPFEMDHRHLWPAINWLTADIQRLAGLRCTVKASPAVAQHFLSTRHSTTMFRVVQEALSNIMKHAAASTLEVKAEIHTGEYSLVISDDGKGISADALQKPGVWGIAGMRERILAIDGVLEIGPREGGGTRLRIKFPLGC